MYVCAHHGGAVPMTYCYSAQGHEFDARPQRLHPDRVKTQENAHVLGYRRRKNQVVEINPEWHPS